MGRSSGGGGGGGGGEGEGCGEAETGITDCSPGIIVWVRRRNGSWWPGRILGPDELPASQVMSPKTGTPVKLLGREDASVDWYNLEKSKRVKAFRCGEFDACIEKALTSRGTPVKRREKYARREDAILHALELERKQLASKYQNQGFRSDDISSVPFADMRREFDNSSTEYYSRNNTQKPQFPLGNSASQHCKDLSSTRYKSKKSKKRKGDSSNLPGKTKGLEQNFPYADSKRDFSESLALEGAENTLSNRNNGSHLGHMQAGPNLGSDGKNTPLTKNISEESVFEESLVKKHDRCRPLAQVVQSSLKLPHSFQRDDDPGPVLIEEGNDPLTTIYQAQQGWSTYMPNDSGETNNHGDIPPTQITSTGAHFETEGYLKQPDSFSAEQKISEFAEKQRSDSCERECSETETEDDAELLQRYAKRQSPGSDACDPYSIQASKKSRHVDGDVADDMVAFSTGIPQQNVLKDEDGSSELGVSQWHMKGKRNQRSALKRPMGKTDGNISLDRSNSSLKGSLYRVNESNPNMESTGASSHQYFGRSFYQTQELDYDYDDADLTNKARGHAEVRYYGKDYPPSLTPTRDLEQSYTSFNNTETYCKTSPPNKNGDQMSSLGRKACLEGASLYRQNYSSQLGYMGPMLFNVDLNVQAGYQGEHVPLVSLMSRLNGKAIVGHPIQIEILEDGSTDHLVLASDDFLEHSTSASPAWRTGRRTAMPRIPRSNSTRVTLDDGDDEGLWDMNPPFSRSSTPFNQQFRLSKRSNTSFRSPLSHRSQKKPSNSKKGSSSSQKVRALSSISIGKRHHREGRQAKLHNILGDLIKPEGAIPLVTCVPAKVVFSRIMEAVGRPSLSIAHRARVASPAIRDAQR
uniref:PWWP domain-containing protein n=1 Tax=Oryza glumipatula TaxID=40148 RepID=A0A0D9ZQ50_9ORYZ